MSLESNQLNLKKKYILITPVKNEEVFIENTIRSVISQTVPPLKWIIVSDGSTDNTNVIVNDYCSRHDFIILIPLENSAERNYRSKVEAFKVGYEMVKKIEFDFIGNLDADITFGSTYYEEILRKFKQNDRLGIAGGVVYDVIRGKIKKSSRNLNSVGCAIQLFPKKCYEEIGGYLPLVMGGEDAFP